MGEQQPVVRARFGQVNVVVSDMERSLAFYRMLGLETEEIPKPWDDHHRTVTNLVERMTVELDSSVSAVNWASTWEPGRTGVVIGFGVGSDEEVDAAVAAIEAAGHRVIQPPHIAFFGARYAVVEDPDGTPVGIMGPVDDGRRRARTPFEGGIGDPSAEQGSQHLVAGGQTTGQHRGETAV